MLTYLSDLALGWRAAAESPKRMALAIPGKGATWRAWFLGDLTMSGQPVPHARNIITDSLGTGGDHRLGFGRSRRLALFKMQGPSEASVPRDGVDRSVIVLGRSC